MAVDFNIEIRRKQLESLDQFVSCSRDKVKSILNGLGWSVDKVQEEQRLFIACPHNDHHKIPAEKIDDHSEICKVKSAGYDLQEEFMSEPIKLSEGSNIIIDNDKKIGVLCQAISEKPYFQTAWNGKDPDPQTYSRLVSTFSKDERLVLYDYCIGNTKGPPELPEFDTSIVTKEKRDCEFTKEALKSFERDIKRRSVKYKPIHTSHKNYKEVLREIINSQMEQYNDWLEHANASDRTHTPDYSQTQESIGDDEELGNQELYQEYSERPHSSISKLSNNSSESQGTKYGRPSRKSHFDYHIPMDRRTKSHYHREYHSNYFSQSSKKHEYTDHDEDSQESLCISKVSAGDMDSSCDNYESTVKTHSRDSSVHSSHRYKEKGTRYKESRRHKTRSDSRELKKRDHSSGSSRHSSRSRRSKEGRYHKHQPREKSKRQRSSHRDT